MSVVKKLCNFCKHGKLLQYSWKENVRGQERKIVKKNTETDP